MAEIADVLEESFFTEAGFEIETFKDDRFLRISLRDNEKYFAELRYKKPSEIDLLARNFGGPDLDRVMETVCAPGDFVEAECVTTPTFQQFLNCLKNWAGRLKSEILLVDIFRKKLEEFQADLNRRLDNHIKDGNAHFTADEREDILAKLRDFQSRISQLEKSNEGLETEMDTLNQLVGDLARAAHTMSKKSWYRTACSKLYSISERALTSKPGQKLIDRVITHFLDGPKGL